MDNNQVRWSSHVPINKSILQTYDITGVLELGIGYYSTPMFFEHAKKVIAVETDLEWIEKIEKDLKTDENHQIIWHELPRGVVRQTRRRQVNEQTLLDARNFMLSLCTDDLNFLFIDCISSLRWEALTYLHEKFDVITFHDYQVPGIHNHYNDGDLRISNEYEMFIDKTYMSHTGILLHKKLLNKLDELKSIHEKEVENFHPAKATIVKYEHNR